MISILLGIVLTGTVAIAASDADTLSRQINKELRTAERMMYGGKKSEADSLLKQIETEIKKLKKMDASNRNLKNLDRKYIKTRKALDKRMKKSAEKVSKPVRTPSRHTKSRSGRSTAADKSSRLIHSIEIKLKKAQRMIDSGHEERAEPYLDQAAEMIGELKATCPSCKQLRDLDHRYGSMTAAGAEKAKATAQMEKDAQAISSMHEKYYAKVEQFYGNTLVYNMNVEEAEHALEKINEAEKALPLYYEELEKLSKKYGTKSMDIYNTFHKAGYKLQNGEDRKMEELLSAKEKLRKSREATAEYLVGNAETLLNAFSNQFNDARLARMQTAKKMLFIGERIDPSNKKLKEMLARIDDQIVQAADKMKAQIDAATWAGNVTQFDGPGNVRDLAAKAKKYFQNDRDWGKKPGRKIEIIDVCVTGQWKVAERDVFSRVIRWRLPIHVAVTDENLRPRNIARVYDLSIVAMQGAPGNSPKKPPFDGFWVGDNWMMRLDKLE